MESFPYTLVRSRRKTLALQVKGNAEVLVRAPLHISAQAVEAFLAAHREWILKHQTAARVREKQFAAFSFADGESFPLLGNEVTITTCRLPVPVQKENGRLLLPEGVADRRAAVVSFLRGEATTLLAERVRFHAAELGVAPAGVKITGAKTRWGSCSGRNSLCFSWRLACLPPALIDYVAAHECAHIREHNHSARFYRLLLSRVPDYRLLEKQLRDWQHKIPF